MSPKPLSVGCYSSPDPTPGLGSPYTQWLQLYLRLMLIAISVMHLLVLIWMQFHLQVCRDLVHDDFESRLIKEVTDEWIEHKCLQVENLRAGTRGGHVMDRFTLLVPCCLSNVKCMLFIFPFAALLLLYLSLLHIYITTTWAFTNFLPSRPELAGCQSYCLPETQNEHVRHALPTLAENLLGNSSCDSGGLHYYNLKPCSLKWAMEGSMTLPCLVCMFGTMTFIV
jgi:hypothetical protein